MHTHSIVNTKLALSLLTISLLAGSATAQCTGVWRIGAGSFGDPGATNVIRAVAVDPANGTVVVGGLFSSANGVAAINIARWNGTTYAPLGTGPNSIVRAIAFASNGGVLLGGDFTSAGGVTANRVAIYNSSPGYSSLGLGVGGGVNGNVWCILPMPNGDVIIGGDFLTANGSPVTRIARLSSNVWSPMGSGMNDRVTALALATNGDVIACGRFSTAGGVAANNVARWNGSAWVAMGSGVPASSMNALAVLPNGDIAIAGAGGVSRWNGTSWQQIGSAIIECFSLVALPCGGLVVGSGGFTSIGGTPASTVAFYNGTAWLPMGSGISGGNNVVYALAQGARPLGGSDVYAGGDFTLANGFTAVDLAHCRFDTPPPFISLHPITTTDLCGSTARMSIDAVTSGPTTYQWRRGGVNLANGPAGSGATISGANTPSITITNAQPTQSGSYDCVVTGPGGCSNTSLAATLTIPICCEADSDHSGGLTVADVFDFLNKWFAGCP